MNLIIAMLFPHNKSLALYTVAMVVMQHAIYRAALDCFDLLIHWATSTFSPGKAP